MLTVTMLDSLTLFVSGFLVGGIVVGTLAHQVFDQGVAMGMTLGRVERVIVKTQELRSLVQQEAR